MTSKRSWRLIAPVGSRKVERTSRSGKIEATLADGVGFWVEHAPKLNGAGEKSYQYGCASQHVSNRSLRICIGLAWMKTILWTRLLLAAAVRRERAPTFLTLQQADAIAIDSTRLAHRLICDLWPTSQKS